MPLIPTLLPVLQALFKGYKGDPTPLANLTIKLITPLSFNHILNMATKEDLVLLLDSPAPATNILGMTMLEKVTASPGDITILATMKEVLASFLIRWLCAPQVEVGHKAQSVLRELLEIDCDARTTHGLTTGGEEPWVIIKPRPLGQGFIWRRLFHDEDMYSIIQRLCVLNPPHTISEELLASVRNQVSLAQGRLLGILPFLAMLNFTEVAKTDFPSLNKQQTGLEGSWGLLQFAALHMVDKRDIIMKHNLNHFFVEFLVTQKVLPYSKYRIDTIREIVREAMQGDDDLRYEILGIPDRGDGSPEMYAWIREIIEP
ncbi:hypothetical protein F5Y16DRAFT_365392 [Xylariaceae sp. FL0255]|nr:hypothetical protein F5Y16DRAFT_365392 [Xylariaceae sp. FL0255]